MAVHPVKVHANPPKMIRENEWINGDRVDLVTGYDPASVEIEVDLRFHVGVHRYETVWRNASRFVTYEESDESWGIPLGMATVQKREHLICGSVVRISDYVSGMTGEAFVDDVWMNQGRYDSSLHVKFVFLSEQKPLVVA
jgi:hypothetical protein